MERRQDAIFVLRVQQLASVTSVSELGPRRRATVVTWMHDEQVGYLDFAYRLAALAEAYEVTVVSRRPLPEPELKDHAEVMVLQPRRGGTAGLVWYWWQVARFLRASAPDLIVHLCSHTAALANLPLGAPQVIYWNEHPSHYLAGMRGPRKWATGLMRKLQYRGARSARLVMPIGEAHHADLLAHGCSVSRLNLIPMGVADTFGAVPWIPSTEVARTNPLRVVYTGSVHVDRGRDVMIDAVAIARSAGVEVSLTIIGADTQQMNHCRTRATAQGVGAFVNVLPRVAGGQIPNFLADADFGICLWADKSYWRFNPPTKLFEYLVAGLPVMASNIRTHTAYLSDGEDGYVFDYDAAALAATFGRAWNERTRWPRLRDAASRRGQQYRWSEIKPKFLGSLSALVR